MSDAGPEQITVLPRPKHRWARREVWFVVAAIILIAGVAIVYRGHPPAHTAPGTPVGGIPAGAPVAIPAAHQSPPPAP